MTEIEKQELQELKNNLEKLDTDTRKQVAFGVQMLLAKQEAEKKREKANV